MALDHFPLPEQTKERLAAKRRIARDAKRAHNRKRAHRAFRQARAKDFHRRAALGILQGQELERFLCDDGHQKYLCADC